MTPASGVGAQASVESLTPAETNSKSRIYADNGCLESNLPCGTTKSDELSVVTLKRDHQRATAYLGEYREVVCDAYCFSLD